MIVYRYMSKKELDLILNNQIDQIGGYFDNTLSNSFSYKSQIKYIHFFKKLEDLNSIIKISTNTKDGYLCKFDIPFLVLLGHRGTGFYNPIGYDYDYMLITEYCLPINKFDSKYLIEYKEIKDGKIADEGLEL